MSAETPIQVNKEELEEVARGLLRVIELNPQILAHAAEEIRALAERLSRLAGEAAARQAAAQEISQRESYLAWRADHLPQLARSHRGEYVAVIPVHGGFEAAGYGSDPEAAAVAAASTHPGRELLPIIERLDG